MSPVCNENENDASPDLSEERMETDGVETKDSDNSSEQTGANMNNDAVSSGSSSDQSMVTNNGDQLRLKSEPVAGPSRSNSDDHPISDGAQASTSKSCEGGTFLLHKLILIVIATHKILYLDIVSLSSKHPYRQNIH